MDTSALASAVSASNLGGEQSKMKMAIVGQQLRMQRETITTLMGSAQAAGQSPGMVTETRGRNMNVTA